jgi:hypothetical protein
MFQAEINKITLLCQQSRILFSADIASKNCEAIEKSLKMCLSCLPAERCVLLEGSSTQLLSLSKFIINLLTFTIR